MDRESCLVERTAGFGDLGSLIGVWTQPSDLDTRRPAVVIISAGTVHRAGPWRLHTQLSRVLAREGLASFRFDLSGIGDSERRTDGAGTRDAIALDVSAALHYVGEHCGVDRFVLLGLCSGAQDALLSAVSDPRVVGVVAMDLIAEMRNWQHRLWHLRKRMLSGPAAWRRALTNRILRLARVVRHTSPEQPQRRRRDLGLEGVRPPLPREELAGVLSRLLERDTRLLLLFSNGLEWNYNHRSQFEENFPALARHPNLTHHFLPGANHTLTARKDRAAAVERITEWLGLDFGSVGPHRAPHGNRDG